jgi:hypothetical protein
MIIYRNFFKDSRFTNHFHFSVQNVFGWALGVQNHEVCVPYCNP